MPPPFPSRAVCAGRKKKKNGVYVRAMAQWWIEETKSAITIQTGTRGKLLFSAVIRRRRWWTRRTLEEIDSFALSFFLSEFLEIKNMPRFSLSPFWMKLIFDDIFEHGVSSFLFVTKNGTFFRKGQKVLEKWKNFHGSLSVTLQRAAYDDVIRRNTYRMYLCVDIHVWYTRSSK